MEFTEFKRLQQEHWQQMLDGQNALFVANVSLEEMWATYLDSFPPGTNEIYRERREYDCNCCKNFIRDIGNVVAITPELKIITIWDFDTYGSHFEPATKALSELVNQSLINGVHVTSLTKFGTDKSFEDLGDWVQTWHHFRLELPKRLTNTSRKADNALKAEYHSTRQVLQRSLEEISKDAIQTTLDLIVENSLYRGEEWRGALESFQQLQNEYESLEMGQHNRWLWLQTTQVGGAVARIRNHSIGVLLQDLTAGVDIVTAVKRFETVVAPENYKRPKEIITKRMVQRAQETAIAIGLEGSLQRKFATLEDIGVNDVIWANADTVKVMGTSDPFTMLVDDVPVDPKQYERLEGISVETFLDEVLPKATTIELLFENRHTSNLVSLIAPKDKTAKPLFKWGNNFSWAYNGNLADSSMKKRVQSFGGKVDGVLRFSIQWNTPEHEDRSDYDAHCVEPNANRIYFGSKHSSFSGGELDVDIIDPGKRVAVENITWPTLKYMKNGIYEFYVHCYMKRGYNGFTAEIEFDGNIYEFTYLQEVSSKAYVHVANVHFNRYSFELQPVLPTSTGEQEVWDMMTSHWQPVSAVVYSPNYWENATNPTGNKHYMFMLASAVNPDTPNGFYNEYLPNDLLEHKRVFAALGSKMQVDPSENQLSGLGFSNTKRNSVICKVDNKIFKVVF